MTLSFLILLCLGIQMSSSQNLLRHKRHWVIDTFTIDEGYNGAYPYSLGKIQVEKELSLFRIHGQGVDEEPFNVLEINENTGEITVHGPVDREKFDMLKLTFQALDREKHVIDTQLGITIDILDANDIVPKFDLDRNEITIKESTLQGTDLITVRATDRDVSENNKNISYRIVSSTPISPNLEFFLMQRKDIGTISFKGCLDHETQEKYTILVEAKDHGKPSLSSTCTIIINIEDGNNHLPMITGRTGPERVKEGQENVLVARIQVMDEDVKGTAAWRAKYHIKEDTNQNFRISTDPETNEGLLYLEKQLNYEEDPVKNITITVDNDIPYISCKVEERTMTGLWKTKILSTTKDKIILSSNQVSVIVEDVNEAPFFDISNKQKYLRENTEVGTYLETFTASDPDRKGANMFKYIKGLDPAGWITVDPKTGEVTTTKIIDRESPFVENGVYVATIHAVDNGEPPMTGTATLSILISDENDNTPFLAVSTVHMCQSDEPSLANITAVDLDGDPYGGPFKFKLLGDVKDKWRVEPEHGYSVNLVKEMKVHPGIYELLLEVFDRQGESSVQNLTVTVCSCYDVKRPNCSARTPAITVGGAAIGIIVASILLLAGLLLLALLLSCSSPKHQIPEDTFTQHLMSWNSEQPGTDCEVPFLIQDDSMDMEQIFTNKNMMMTPVSFNFGDTISNPPMSQFQATIQQRQYEESPRIQSWSRECVDFQKRSIRGNFFQNSAATTISGSATSQIHLERSKSIRKSMRRGGNADGTGTATDYLDQSLLRQEILLRKAFGIMITSLQAQDQELGDYDPHVYADEGDSDHNFELDTISNPEVPFDPDLNYDIKFSTLASVCMPDDPQHRNLRYQQ